MFHKKKFTVAEQEDKKKMYNAKNIKWLHYLIVVGLIAFVLLIILANVKSKSYYKNREAAKKANKEINSGSRSILSLDEVASRTMDCSIRYCAVTCTGDIINLSQYLNSQKSCPSMTLTISGGSFPDDRLQSDWLKGTFILKCINITQSTLRGIDSGAFNQNTVATLTELKLDKVKLSELNEDTFVGLKAVEIFTLVNEIEIFSGNSFLKPMEKTLKTLTIQHITKTPTDPGPWLRGNFPKLTAIYFQNNNFGGFINMDTFRHLDELYFLSMGKSKINYLPDGVFDFMMSGFLTYIFIEGNQLNRIAGNYLTKVSKNKLTYVIASDNPWDCTCELEDLIKEYKRDPEGFGGNLYCSTPPEHAGKLLSQVTVDRCEDTTTVLPTTTTSSSTTTTTTVSTPPTTETSPTTTISSTTPALEEPTTESSSSTTTTEVTESPVTTESTLPPNSTTSSTEEAAPTTSSEPNSTTEEPSESTPDNPSEGSSTTALTTLPIDDDTSPPPQTTPSPQNRTTTMSAVQTVTIECQRYSAQFTESPGLYVELSRPDTHFYITYLTETSAYLTMESTSDELALIWFYEQPMFNGSGENIRIVGEFKVGCQSELEESLLIEGLAQRRAYTFCLVKEGVHFVSPFNCISYYTSNTVFGETDEVWLKSEQKALTIGLLILGILLSLCLGACGMFLILRVHPMLLKGSKRVIVVNRSTGDVLVMPRPGGKSSITDSSYRDSYETSTTIRQRRLSEASIHSGRSYMMANNYEDIEYRWKMNAVNDMIYAHRVPKSPPPPLPKRISQATSTGEENDDKMKIAVISQKGNDYGYMYSMK